MQRVRNPSLNTDSDRPRTAGMYVGLMGGYSFVRGEGFVAAR